MSNLYWKPEQPPPSTETRSIAPCGSRCRISPIRRAALSEIETLSIVPSGVRRCQKPHRLVKYAARRGQQSPRRIAELAMNARAPFAQEAASSRGRLHREAESASRNAFRRDADRIIH